MAIYIPKNSTLTISTPVSVNAKNFNAEYMTDFPRKEAEPVDILNSLNALRFDRPNFIAILTKAMLEYHGRSFVVHSLDTEFVGYSFNQLHFAGRTISVEVQPRKFTQYGLETSEPLGIRCSIVGCSVREFFIMLREMPGIGAHLDSTCSFLEEVADFISSWNNDKRSFFFDIVYNHRFRLRKNPAFEAAEETGKVFLPGGYILGNTADYFISRKLRPHLKELARLNISYAMSVEERSPLRIVLTRRDADSSFIFSPPESGHLWGHCHIDRKITDLTLNNRQMTEAELALIDMAGMKDELLLDMPYDLNQTKYF